jgi:AraC-like DNA-binding protein
MELFICQFCQQKTKKQNKNSLSNHERCCPLNPNRNYKNGMTGKTGSNQCKKARELGLAIPKGIATRGMLGKTVSSETKEKISSTRKQMFNEGRLSGKNRIRYYEQNPEKSTYIYLVQFSNEYESFIKVGISEVGVAKRFNSSSYAQYSIKIIREHYINAYSAALIERQLLRSFRKNFGYNPQNFIGRTECIKMELLEVFQTAFDEEIRSRGFNSHRGRH